MRIYKLWLDDIRKPPDFEWLWVTTSKQMITWLDLFGDKCYEIELDHDLGAEENGNGYDVLKWIEEKVYLNKNWVPPKIGIHTDNPVAKERMIQAVKSIDKIVKENEL